MIGVRSNGDSDHAHSEKRNSRIVTISSLPCQLSPTRLAKWPGRNRVQIPGNTSGQVARKEPCANSMQHVWPSGQEGTVCKFQATRLAKWPGRNRVQIPRNTSGQVARKEPCANSTQHIGRSSRAACGPRGSKGQLSYEAGQSLNRIYFNFVLWAQTINP